MQAAREAKRRMRYTCLSSSCLQTTAAARETSGDNTIPTSMEDAMPTRLEVLEVLADMEAHWEGYNSDETDEEECEVTDNEDEADVDSARNAFERMLLAMQGKDPLASENLTVGLYQRRSKLSERQERRKRATAKQLSKAAESCKSLGKYGFVPQARPEPVAESSRERLRKKSWKAEERRLSLAVEDMQKKLRSKNGSALQGQNRTRHEAVLHFMRLSRHENAGTRKEKALSVARCFGKGSFFARKIIHWERTWVSERSIEEGRQGCYSKVQSWLNDEGVQLAIRDYLAGKKDCKKILWLHIR
jgi:hypothetical protein